MEVHAAIRKARRTLRRVSREGIEVKQRPAGALYECGGQALVRDRVRSLLSDPVRGGRSLPTRPPVKRAMGRKGMKASDQVVLRLRNELARNRAYVQAMIKDQESTNEELKTANEEALSSMEELQSTNEELETAKEELQSSNEELVTLNEQLQSRNSALASRSDQLNNVLSASNIPILILDGERRIQLFTPAAEKALGLLQADVGRPISKVRLGIHVPELAELISTVAEKAADVRREVQSEDGRWYALHLRPFWTAEKTIDGVLMAFVDIDQLKQQQGELQKDRASLQKDKDFITTILDASKDLLVVILDREGRIVHFNRVCQQLTGYSLQEVQGRHLRDFLLVPEEVESVEASFREVLAGTPVQRENHWVAKDGRRLLISWSHNVVKSGVEVESVIKTGVDVTAREKMKHRAQESEDTIRALLESAVQAILACDKDGRIMLVNAAAEKLYGYGRDELVGQSLESLIPERLQKAHALHRATWFREPRSRPMGVGLDLAGLRKDGSEFPVEVSLSYIGDRGGIIGAAFISDITERKKHEQTLFQYKDQLQKLTGALLFSAGDRQPGGRPGTARRFQPGTGGCRDGDLVLEGGRQVRRRSHRAPFRPREENRAPYGRYSSHLAGTSPGGPGRTGPGASALREECESFRRASASRSSSVPRLCRLNFPIT